VVLPPARPCPTPRPVTPGESALLPPDSDDGFNIRKRRERDALLAKMRKEAAASIAAKAAASVASAASVVASGADAPPESVYPTSGHSDENEDEGLQEEGMGQGPGLDDEEEEGSGQDEGDDEDAPRLDSDFERRAFSRMIRHGLDPRDSDVQEVLRHGPPPCYEEGEDESEDDGVANNVHEYNFNEWVHYEGGPMQEGPQSNVEKLTRYRIRGDKAWLPIPDGLRVPRHSSNQEQQVEQHLLACRKLGTTPINFRESQPPKATAKVVQRLVPPPSQPTKPKSKPSAPGPAKIGAGGPDKTMSGAGNSKVNPRGLRQTLIELGMAVEPNADMEVDESDPSGSDYSETRKDARRRMGEGDADESEDEESSDGDAGRERTSKLGKGAKDGDDSSNSSEDDASSGEDNGEVDGRNSREDSEDENQGAEAAPKKKGRVEEVGAQGGSNGGAKRAIGRPGKDQMQAVKELRGLIDREVQKLSNEFNASHDTLLGQLGFSGKAHRKMSLLNLFSQIKSLEEPQEGVHGRSCFFLGIC